MHDSDKSFRGSYSVITKHMQHCVLLSQQDTVWCDGCPGPTTATAVKSQSVCCQWSSSCVLQNGEETDPSKDARDNSRTFPDVGQTSDSISHELFPGNCTYLSHQAFLVSFLYGLCGHSSSGQLPKLLVTTCACRCVSHTSDMCTYANQDTVIVCNCVHECVCVCVHACAVATKHQ